MVPVTSGGVGAKALPCLIAHRPGRDRPAEIPAAFDHVDLVAIVLAVFVLPQFTRLRMEGEPLRIAVAVGPDRVIGLRVVDEGVVGGIDPSALSAGSSRGRCCGPARNAADLKSFELRSPTVTNRWPSSSKASREP